MDNRWGNMRINDASIVGMPAKRHWFYFEGKPMTVAKSFKRKPGKPRPDWPLTALLNGQWVKKIKGKVFLFGRWDQPE
jgi:hypothetical protein